MAKSIMKILILALIITIPICYNWYTSEEGNKDPVKYPVEILSKNSIIKFSEEKLIVTDIYDIQVNPYVKYNYTSYFLPMKLDEDAGEYEPTITKILLDDSEIIVDGNDLIEDGVRYPNSIGMISNIHEDGKYFGSIWTNHLGLTKEGRRHLEITYEYETDKVVKQYDDVSVMKLHVGTNKFVLPKEFDNIETDSFGIDIIKESDNVYLVRVNEFSKTINDEITVLFENGILNNAKMIEGKYAEARGIKSFKTITQNKYFPVAAIFSTLLLVLLLISSILVQKPKFKNEYTREPKEIVDPILAEVLIDGKFGAKELVMTCILNSIKKGAIEVFDNEILKLKSYDNLNYREKKILSLFFEKPGQYAKISDIKNVFIKDNVKSKNFYETFLEVKNDILSEALYRGLYSKIGDVILKIIRVISALIFVNILPVLTNFAKYSIELTAEELLVLNGITLGIMLVSIFSESVGKLFKLDYRHTAYNFLLLPCLILLLGVQFFWIIFSPAVLVVTILLFVINYIVYKQSQKHVLTRKGKEEYMKVLGLKKYIEDFSIMEKRDIEEIVLWDDYLVYATAFGIPNKITNKFAESFLNANINLQKINRIIGM